MKKNSLIRRFPLIADVLKILPKDYILPAEPPKDTDKAVGGVGAKYMTRLEKKFYTAWRIWERKASEQVLTKGFASRIDQPQFCNIENFFDDPKKKKHKALLLADLYSCIFDVLLRSRLKIYSDFPVPRNDGKIYIREWELSDAFEQIDKAFRVLYDKTELKLSDIIRVGQIQERVNFLESLDDLDFILKKRGLIDPPYDETYTDRPVAEMTDQELHLFSAARIYYLEAIWHFKKMTVKDLENKNKELYEKFADAKFKFEAFATLMYAMIKLRLEFCNADITVRKGRQVCLFDSSKKVLEDLKFIFNFLGI